jgi:hypothetical protein
MNSVPPAGPGKPCAFPGVPEYFQRVIGDVERDNLPFFWKLQKNVDGVSLSLFPAKNSKRRHIGNVWKKTTHASESVNTDSLSKEQDHTRAVPDTKPTHGNAELKRRRKSPSCKLRDRNRRKSWGRRKPSHIRPLSTCESGNSIHGEGADTNRETVQESLLVHSKPSGTDTNHSVVLDSLPTRMVFPPECCDIPDDNVVTSYDTAPSNNFDESSPRVNDALRQELSTFSPECCDIPDDNVVISSDTGASNLVTSYDIAPSNFVTPSKPTPSDHQSSIAEYRLRLTDYSRRSSPCVSLDERQEPGFVPHLCSFPDSLGPNRYESESDPDDNSDYENEVEFRQFIARIPRVCAACCVPESSTVEIFYCHLCRVTCYCSIECQTSHYEDSHGDECRGAVAKLMAAC